MYHNGYIISVKNWALLYNTIQYILRCVILIPGSRPDLHTFVYIVLF